jgi:hypothetical protein
VHDLFVGARKDQQHSDNGLARAFHSGGRLIFAHDAIIVVRNNVFVSTEMVGGTV